MKKIYLYKTTYRIALTQANFASLFWSFFSKGEGVEKLFGETVYEKDEEEKKK